MKRQQSNQRKRCPENLNDEGCLELIGAVIRQAMEDHVRAKKLLPGRRAARILREINVFFRSAYFRNLTGPHSEEILRRIRKEVDRDDPA